MDPYWYALACVVIGGTLGVVVPYLFKVMDSEVTFSFSYFYALCVSMAIAAVGLVPESVGDMTGRMIMILIMAGFGIQNIAGLVTSKVRKGVATKDA